MRPRNQRHGAPGRAGSALPPAPRRPAVLLAVILPLAAFSAPGAEPDLTAASPARGEQLYQNHCTGCHDSVVHVRERRKAATLAEVQAQILRWRQVLALPWRDDDVRDVLQHLNERYYRYPR